MTHAATISVLARLRAAHPQSSGRRVKAWLTEGRVRVNGRVVRDPRQPVGPEDTVQLGPRGLPVFPAPLGLVHEDDDLIVIDKPAGLLTIATGSERHRTAYRLLWNYLATERPPRRPFIVHRLDRDTSGLLVVAKSPATKRALQAQLQARTVERVYVAVVEGTVRTEHGTQTSTLVEDRSLRVRSTRRGDRGRPAVTHYRVLERRGDVTLLELALRTGRRRQLRVQLAELGHPILGDREHGGRRDPLRRLCLHATRLAFRHPTTGAWITFKSPAPAAFAGVGRRQPDHPAPPRAPRGPHPRRGG